MNRKYILWLDALKGTGIILVILSHSYHFDKASSYLFSGYMALFFLVSGYTCKEESIMSYMQKKSRRLLFPYFTYGVLITALFTLIPVVLKKEFKDIYFYKWIGVLYSRYSIYPLGESDNLILLYPEVSPLWFLTGMFLSLILFSIYINAKRKHVIILSYIILSAICYNVPILLPWSIDTSFIFALLIVTGYYLKDILIKCNMNIFIICIIFYFILVSINGNVNISIRQYGEQGYWSIIMFYVIGVLYTIILSMFFKTMENTLFCAVLAYIGKISLPLMCLHMPIILILKAFIPSYCSPIFIPILGIILSITICYIINKIINGFSVKYPILRWL